MRTSLTEIQNIEAFLDGKMPYEEGLLFEAKMLTQPSLREKTTLQQKIYRLVHLFHRKRMKQDLESIHQQLFNDPQKKEFQKQIVQLFNS